MKLLKNSCGLYFVTASLLTVLGCGADDQAVDVHPLEQMLRPATGCASMPVVECSGTPAVGAKLPWRHGIKSRLVTLAGNPRHRGIDLIVAADSSQQVLRGEIKYGAIDKSLEDEDVEVFACQAGAWQPLGIATTDGEGTFALTLHGAARLTVGRRSMFVSVRGDRSAVNFWAVVTPRGGKAAVSDIDGTLTTSENAFPESLFTGQDVPAWDGAPQALSTLQGLCYQPVYLSSRGRIFTEVTRDWLAAKGFPAGPLHLAPQLLTLPGDSTLDYKIAALVEIQSGGVGTAVGFGNRGTDAQAYLATSVENIFLNRAEFASEVDPFISRGEALGFDNYPSILPILRTFPKAP